MIFRKKLLVFIPLCLIVFLSQYLLQALAGSGYPASENKQGNYSEFEADTVRKEADDLFIKAFDSTSASERDKYYSLSLVKYYILSKIKPLDFYACAQMARIYDNQGNDRLAKKNYYMSFNLDRYNPYSNFYFGEYHLKRKMYYKALKYYLIAYNNGYKDNFVTNLKLAGLYEKLGDLKKSKELYAKAYKLNPEATDLKTKIQDINSSNYEKSEYYHLIRE